MTAYNQEQFIAEAIESVLALYYNNWELIITDDQSTDSTFKICENYASLDSRIKLYKNNKNLGDYKNRNTAAGYAKGKYLKFLDADDLIYPYGLNAMVDSMEQFPEAGFGLSFSVVDDVIPYPQLVSSSCIIRNEFLYKSLVGVGPSASIIRRDIFVEVGGFSGALYIGDIELWYKISERYPLVKLAPALNWYRVHENQQTKFESRDNSIAIIRFKLSYDFLFRNKNLFNSNELQFAEKKLKRNFIRKNIKKCIDNKDIGKLFEVIRAAKLSYIDLFEGFRPYLHNYSIS
jgi:glycosyltransferase involved in cell wall biosynthesis